MLTSNLKAMIARHWVERILQAEAASGRDLVVVSPNGGRDPETANDLGARIRRVFDTLELSPHEFIMVSEEALARERPSVTEDEPWPLMYTLLAVRAAFEPDTLPQAVAVAGG